MKALYFHTHETAHKKTFTPVIMIIHKQFSIPLWFYILALLDSQLFYAHIIFWL